MPQTIENSDDAKFVVEMIRNGSLQGERKEAAFAALETFHLKTPVVKPKTRELQNFVERMIIRFGERGKMFVEIAEADLNDDQTYAESIFQVTGKVGMASIFYCVMEGIVRAVRGLFNITPDVS